jgi:PAS domain S-box-containing protein
MNGSDSGDDAPGPTRSPRRSLSHAEAGVLTRDVGAPSTIVEGSGLYQLLVESVLEYAIFALDPHGFILSWNSGAQHFKGYTANEIIGKHFSVFYPEDVRAAGKPEEELRIAARDGMVEDEGWRVRKDGTQFWANVVITALRDPQGTLVGFAKVTRDLTDRRRAEETLRVSEERFRLLVQSVKDYGIFMLDPDGRVASWNEGARRIKGYEADEILGRHFSIFYPREALESGLPQHELVVARGVGRFEDEGWRLRKDGSRFWAYVVITALRKVQQVVLGVA